MEDIIIVLFVFAIVVSILRYFNREKKRGATCIGCPYAGLCSREKCEAESGIIKSNEEYTII